MAPAAREKLGAAKNIVVQVATIAVLGKDGADAHLGVIGSLVDQVHDAAKNGLNVSLVVSGPNSSRALDAFKAVLSLKGQPPSGSITASPWEGDSAVAADKAAEAQASVLLYLTHLSGVPSGKGKVLPVYTPSFDMGPTHSCSPGLQLVQSAWAAAQGGGLSVVMASAKEQDVVARLLAGEEVGTLFDVAAAVAAAEESASASASASGARDMAVRARAASRQLQLLPSSEREAMLNRVADALLAHQEEILAENAKDVQESTGKVGDALLQRLILKPAKIELLAEGIRAIARQEEPIGKLLSRTEVAEGLVLDKISSPIGVLLIIFEARPDALPQIASLAIRSGNGLLLKGGKEAARSNAVLHRTIVEAVGPLGRDLIGLITTRDEINDLLALDDVIDLVIPRGGNALVSHIQRSTRIPVLGHADGVCHLYVDEEADLGVAMKIMVDAKTDYPAACNAVEKVLLHKAWVGKGVLEAVKAALEAAGVTVYAGEDAAASGLLPGSPALPAQRHEYSALAVTLEVVDSMQQAVDHIHAHGSSHTDCIVTTNSKTAEAFLRAVDSACVFHNASTRFADGFRFGLGAEVGISTSRIHARGPVGVEGLLTTKWLMRGSGQVVAKDKGVVYTHRRLDMSDK